MKIKVCGLFRKEDISFANELRPDYIGFVFFPKSHRNVTVGQAAKLRSGLDSGICPVGVFVDEDPGYIAGIADKGIIDAVQLHGCETAEYVRGLRKMLPAGVPVIKSFCVSGEDDLKKAYGFPSDYILLDSGKGSGRTFSWDLLGGRIPENTFLAGGICVENISEAMRIQPYCIDVSSGAETDKVKDREKMAELIHAVRSYRAE